MKDILANSFVEYLNGRRQHIAGFTAAQVPSPVPYEATSSESFDLLDKAEPFVIGIGCGSVTYHNPQQRNIIAVNYEEFLNRLPSEVTKDMKRPDFIVYDMDNGKGDYFIINELSQGKPASKRNDAKLQMHSALKYFSADKETWKFISRRKARLCVFSCRTQFPQTPDGIADAFGINSKKLPKKVAIKFQPITKVGFEAFESDVIHIE